MNRRNFLARLSAAFAGIAAAMRLPDKAKPIIVESPKTISRSPILGLYSRLSDDAGLNGFYNWWERDPSTPACHHNEGSHDGKHT